MLAYHNNILIKQKYLDRVAAHKAADEIVKGQYWECGKGCAVGCTVHSSNHEAYETELGIPQMLARLEDTIFEGLPNDIAKEWPERFLKAAKVGSDLSLVGYQFMYWNLIDNLRVEGDGEVFDKVRAAIQQCTEALYPLTKGEPVNIESAESAESAARSAARSAAWSAARSAARSAAWSAAESAAGSARSAACSAAESAAYERMADKLIELMENTI